MRPGGRLTVRLHACANDLSLSSTLMVRKCVHCVALSVARQLLLQHNRSDVAVFVRIVELCVCVWLLRGNGN